MGGIGAVAEPLVVIFLLFGGTWINRDYDPVRRWRRTPGNSIRRVSDDVESGMRGTIRTTSEAINLQEEVEDGVDPRSSSPSLLATQEPNYRTRTLKFWALKKEVTTPNTRRFKAYFLSRLLESFPFLVECWYWALIYWVYQLGRAATAVWIVEGTVFAARKHALQVIAVEEELRIFYEVPIQRFFLQRQFMMTWIDRIYSFIHIPGSIAFLVWLFYYTNTRNRVEESARELQVIGVGSRYAGPRLYEARRRTMALCNLLAFIVFTLWPCMPPRLLSADTTPDPAGKLARGYGFVDTVHGPGREGSIWTDNRFTNKFAAMPSLHFGYSLLIGVTIMTIPLDKLPHTSFKLPKLSKGHVQFAQAIKLPSWQRLCCILVGIFYPALILVAIIATANHFILDAVAGAVVCSAAWWGNDVLLNLLAVEDWFLWLVRIHKPDSGIVVGDERRDKRDSLKWKGADLAPYLSND